MNRRERIIDIKALIKCTLEKWRLLLLAGLLCGAVLGGREGYSQYKAYQKGLEAEAAEAANLRHRAERRSRRRLRRRTASTARSS